MTEYNALSAPEQIELQDEVRRLRKVLENVGKSIGNAQAHYHDCDCPHLRHSIDTAMVWVKSEMCRRR